MAVVVFFNSLVVYLLPLVNPFTFNFFFLILPNIFFNNTYIFFL